MKKALLLFSCILCCIVSSELPGQTQMPLPAHASNYSGMARGYWFVAPTDFTITGLKVAPEAGSGLQYIHLLKCHAQLPIAFGSPSTNFTTLTYISGAVNNTIAPVNIPVQQGDTIVVIGTVTGNNNSYTTSAINHTSTIGTHSITMGRAGTQNSIETSAAPNFWGYETTTTYQLGRVFIYYSLASATDAGLQTFVFPNDTTCEGANDVVVRLKNHGPQPLVSVDIAWSVNNTIQPVFSWSGNLPINDSNDVVLGSVPMVANTPYSIQAYTHEPNNVVDTFNNLNDTIQFTVSSVKPAPQLSLYDTIITICEGDTAWITGTLSGSPPWSFTLDDGSNPVQYTGIMNAAVSIAVSPSVMSTYEFLSIQDAGGCETATGPTVTITLQPAPPASITPTGSTAACSGDSVKLMGSVGLNFGYKWYKDGVMIPGQTSYLFSAKETGNYTVTVLSPIGCSSTSAPIQVYIHPNPVVTLGNDTAILPGQTVILNAGAGFNSYLWSTGATTQTINASSAVVGVIPYWVQVTDNNGCKGGDTITINFTNHPGIVKFNKTPGFTIVPNPASDLVEVHWDYMINEPLSLTIITLDGRKVVQKTLFPSDGKALLDVSALPAGNYLIQLSSLTNSTIQRLVVVR